MDKKIIELPLEVEEAPKKISRVNEIAELRGQNSKVYRMSDGSQQAVFFSNAVHVFDEETKRFEEVEHGLVMEEDGKHYRNGKNGFVARFSCEKDNDELFSVEQGMHRVSVSLKKSIKKRGRGVMPKVHKKQGLLYENVEAGADMEYTVVDGGVKENILVKEKADVYRYAFTLHCEHVTAQYDEKANRIAFLSNETGKEVFFIPTPFMEDAKGVVSTAVAYEVKVVGNEDAQLTVIADSEWMNSEERVFPVTIDPQIMVSGNISMNTYSWEAGNLYSGTRHTIGTTGEGDGNCNANRMYMSFAMPTLPRNPRIKKAELTFTQYKGTIECYNYPKFGLYQVTGPISTGICTPVSSSDLMDYEVMKAGDYDCGDRITYTFDITKLVDQLDKNESYYPNLVLKMLDESYQECNCSMTLFGSDNGELSPQICITYETSYGVNTSYRTHSHQLGRLGQGSIDLQCGNLMLVSEDFAWSGNRMPVTLQHLYNSALSDYPYTANDSIKLNVADFTAMNLGYGWKLNVMQSMVSATFQHEGIVYNGYVYVGEKGEEIYFKESDETVCCDSNSQCKPLYEDINDNGMKYDPSKYTLTDESTTYLFDAAGRLISVTDEHGNHMDITYTAGRITSVTDGAGRDFSFAYNSNGFLTSITAPDGTSIRYAYSGNLLSDITYSDGRQVTIACAENKPGLIYQRNADGRLVYRVMYNFSGDRLCQVTECGESETGESVVGASTTYSYSVASRRTIVHTTEQMDAEEGETADNVIKTVYTFDDNGEVISEYLYSEDTGNVGVDGEGSGIHPFAGEGGAGVVSNINNLLRDHNFTSTTFWSHVNGNCGKASTAYMPYEKSAKYGISVLWIQTYNTACKEEGIEQITNVLPAGDYTFSVYLQSLTNFLGPNNAGAYIRVTDVCGNILAESERLTNSDTEFIRLIAPFKLDTAQCVHAQILVDGMGIVYANAAQLENNPFANAYNLLENGNFERGIYLWSQNGATITTEERFNMSQSLKITGNPDYMRYAYQTVTVKKNRGIRETFTLSGWAKGYGLVKRERNNAQTSQFRLRAVVKYYDSYYKDYSSETYTADFSPCTEEWQFASVEFTKSKYRNIQDIQVYCDYSYNSGTVYFDDIQLIRNSIETDLTADDFIVNETNDETTDETTTEESTSGVADFEELRDEFGNMLTETTYTDGEFGTIYRAFGFNKDSSEMPGDNSGNDLISETDTRGNKTLYKVDEDASRNEEVTDRCGNKTAYEYDVAGRTTKVISKDAQDTELANVSYAYDSFDNMTEIVRGDGLKYVLAYNTLHNLESIGVDGMEQPLVHYTYKNSNGRLKQVAYANGDVMKASYNSIGQMVAERWYDMSNTLTAYYKYVYDGQGNLVRSIDMKSEKEYNYIYEDGKIVRAIEYDIVINEDEFIIRKTVVTTVIYTYDSEGKLTRKRFLPAEGTEQVIYYENAEDDNTVVKFTAGGRTVTSHSKNDTFGRKVFDELQFETGFAARQFNYHAGHVTETHEDGEKLKSAPTTQLVERIILSDGRILSYEYDEEERITKVTDSVEGVTEYTYDALGQLLKETVNGEVVNEMTYDNYSNILTRNGHAYIYGDTVWRDRLTAVDDKSITYDAQGNPTNYFGYELTWEKSRQLKSFGQNTYTYNANGIRTSKTVNGVTHTYTLDGTNILRETWGDNELLPMYDNEDNVCGIIYNDNPFYFLKNLQGDIIAIVDKVADVVARYSYDAWGVCTIVSDTSGCNIAMINPYRYRSYYYDVEIGMYYLQSRYYDPAVGRFINADDAVIVGIPNGETLHNIFTYCENEPILNSDYQGFFVIRRWMVSAIADFLLSLIPGIGPLFAPVKTIAKSYGKAALKSKLAGPLGSFVKFVARNASKLLRGLKNGLSKLWGIGRWLASKIPVGKLTSLLAGLTSTVLVNKFLNIIVRNIDIILSVGGLISGILDYIFDKSLNNSIWVI